jgi:hypothetical protein
MFQFDSLAARALLDALYTNDLDIYPDDFARLIRGSAPTTAQVAAALEGDSVLSSGGKATVASCLC